MPLPIYYLSLTDFPGGSDGKASAYIAGDPGSIPGLGRSPRVGNGSLYSCLEILLLHFTASKQVDVGNLSWSGLPFLSLGDLPNPGIEPGSPALQADSLPTELQGKSIHSKGASNTPSDPTILRLHVAKASHRCTKPDKQPQSLQNEVHWCHRLAILSCGPLCPPRGLW